MWRCSGHTPNEALCTFASSSGNNLNRFLHPGSLSIPIQRQAYLSHVKVSQPAVSHTKFISCLLNTLIHAIRISYLQIYLPQHIKHFYRQGPGFIKPTFPALHSAGVGSEKMFKGLFVVAKVSRYRNRTGNIRSKTYPEPGKMVNAYNPSYREDWKFNLGNLMRNYLKF